MVLKLLVSRFFLWWSPATYKRQRERLWHCTPVLNLKVADHMPCWCALSCGLLAYLLTYWRASAKLNSCAWLVRDSFRCGPQGLTRTPISHAEIDSENRLWRGQKSGAQIKVSKYIKMKIFVCAGSNNNNNNNNNSRLPEGVSKEEIQQWRLSRAGC